MIGIGLVGVGIYRFLSKETPVGRDEIVSSVPIAGSSQNTAYMTS